MKLDTYVNPKRFANLLKNELFSNYKTILIGTGAVFGLLLIINVASVSSNAYWMFHQVFYPLTLFIGGFFLTAMIFHDLHDKERGYGYLTLPASLFEKFISRLLLTTVGYVIGSLFLYWLFSVVAAGITGLFFKISHPVFNPFSSFIWYMIRIYIVTQSVIFFGALFFRKHNLIKTILSIYLCQVLIVNYYHYPILPPIANPNEFHYI